jgi:protein-S-isoprenylcysteine O-methyltransferase Ste14
MDFFLRIATILLFIVWKTYWKVTEIKADREKPKTQPEPAFFSTRRLSRNLFVLVVGFLILLPLVGVEILPMEYNPLVQLIGFVFVITGISLSIASRRLLGTNWANAHEYQIKHKQILVTTGIYSYIRHPIYTGLILATTGAELVAQSYLFILFACFFYMIYRQAKKEEKILEDHFGKAYIDYKKRSKMLIPFIF